MIQQICPRLAVTVLGLGCLLNPMMGCAANPYHLEKEITVGGEGGWDYLSVDAVGRRLYVTHGAKVVVIDLDQHTVVGEIADTPGVHGFAVAADLGRGFSSNGQESKVSVVDLVTLKTLQKVPTGQGPDAIIYEPGQREVYVFNGRGHSVTVIDAKTAAVVSTVGLSGQPEFAASDPKSGRVYCNIEDRSEVVAIDSKTHKVSNTWPIAPGKEAAGMAFDAAHHRLFLGCHNRLMVMLDSTTGNVVATVPIGSGVDANAFDPETQLAFSSNGDGTVTIAHEDSPEKLTVVQTLATQNGARTMALDPKTHRIYLASARFEPQSAPAAGEPRRRPKMLPNSFRVLVYGQEKSP